MASVVVLGGNFAGLTASLEIARRLKKISPSHKVTVISPADRFLYVPSMIWMAFGGRELKDISFEIAPVFQRRNVEFIHDEAVRVDPDNNSVETRNSGAVPYDYLVVSTGCDMKFDGIPGLDKGYTECIVTPAQALRAYGAFKRLLDEPGPVVVGATQNASCMGAAYEYLFNLEKQLRKHNVRDKVPLTWITPEPELGHFGIGGVRGGTSMLKTFMKMFKIEWVTDSVIREIQQDRIILENGRVLQYKMAMLIPPFVGVKAMRNTPQLTDDKGFVVCTDAYHHEKYRNVFAAGLAVRVVAPFKNCAAPFGVPKTGFPSEVQGKVVAKNISRAVRGIGELHEMPFGRIPGICIMDAGSKEVFILTSSLFKPRAFEFIIPNVFYNFGKIALEKYMLLKNKRGWTFLP